MKHALAVTHKALHELYKNLGFYLALSVCWWIAVLPILTLGPATAGLFAVIRAKIHGENPSVSSFWQESRSYLKDGFILSILYLFIMVPGVLYTLLLFSNNSLVAYVLALLVIYLLISWNLLYLLTVPLLIEQKEKRLGLAFLRAFRLIIDRYAVTFQMALYLFLVTLLCTVLTILLLIWAAWIAIIMTYYLLSLLEKYDPESYSFNSEVSWKNTWKEWK